jgi:hypothetical protein
VVEEGGPDGLGALVAEFPPRQAGGVGSAVGEEPGDELEGGGLGWDWDPAAAVGPGRLDDGPVGTATETWLRDEIHQVDHALVTSSLTTRRTRSAVSPSTSAAAQASPTEDRARPALVGIARQLQLVVHHPGLSPVFGLSPSYPSGGR